jgi:hypothetical protein
MVCSNVDSVNFRVLTIASKVGIVNIYFY